MERPTRPVRGGGASRGFTLVELMIAIALMLLITMQLQIIFNGSRQMFQNAEALVEVFQNARAALDLMERDLSNTIKTDQMEFFQDIRTRDVGVGHFNGDEIIADLRESFFPGTPYVYSLAIKQPNEFRSGFPQDGGPYRRDAVYFRTLTMIDGVPKEALVEYFLWTGTDNDPRRLPILRRRVVEVERIDSQGKPVLKKHAPVDVCYFVQEFKVELFYRDRSRAYVGRFYDARQAMKNGTPPAGDLRPPVLPRHGTSEAPGIICAETGDAQLDTKTAQLTVPNTRLAAFAPGDDFYVLTQPLPGQTFQTDFGGYLTIKEIDRSESGAVKVSFEQETTMLNMMKLLSVPRLTVSWRAAFLPAALRVTLKIKDGKSRELRTIQRIFEVGS